MSDGEHLQLYVEIWEDIILIKCLLWENYLPTPWVCCGPSIPLNQSNCCISWAAFSWSARLNVSRWKSCMSWDALVSWIIDSIWNRSIRRAASLGVSTQKGNGLCDRKFISVRWTEGSTTAVGSSSREFTFSSKPWMTFCAELVSSRQLEEGLGAQFPETCKFGWEDRPCETYSLHQ